MTKKAPARPRKSPPSAPRPRLRFFVLGLLVVAAAMAGIVFFVPQDKLPASVKGLPAITKIYDAGERLAALRRKTPTPEAALPKEQGYTSKDRQTLDHLIESETP